MKQWVNGMEVVDEIVVGELGKNKIEENEKRE
jgi:hypothetical protein